jgi:hypothetical protein
MTAGRCSRGVWELGQRNNSGAEGYGFEPYRPYQQISNLQGRVKQAGAAGYHWGTAPARTELVGLLDRQQFPVLLL